jgi:hypothetical protein
VTGHLRQKLAAVILGQLRGAQVRRDGNAGAQHSADEKRKNPKRKKVSGCSTREESQHAEREPSAHNKVAQQQRRSGSVERRRRRRGGAHSLRYTLSVSEPLAGTLALHGHHGKSSLKDAPLQLQPEGRQRRLTKSGEPPKPPPQPRKGDLQVPRHCAAGHWQSGSGLCVPALPDRGGRQQSERGGTGGSAAHALAHLHVLK